MSGALLLVLHSHLPYVIRHGRWPHGVEWLCEAAAECYIPLLRELLALREEGYRQVLTLSFSPVLLEQLADEEFASIFRDYLDERIGSLEMDEREFSGRNEREMARVAAYWVDWYGGIREEFSGRFDDDLVGAFRQVRDSGVVALQTCGATHGYFPLLGRDESIHAQVQIGVETHVRHFGTRPRGIWMPECAYRPEGWWHPPVPSEELPGYDRIGVERFLAAGGIDHTFVDAHTVRAGRPVDWYAHLLGTGEVGSPVSLDDPRSVYRHYAISGAAAAQVSVFPRDVETALHVWSSKSGYPGGAPYLEFHKKYHRSGGRYWRVTGREVELGEKIPYDPESAADQVEHDAAEFAGIVSRRMRACREQTGGEGTICLPFDTELFGHWWHEGPAFLGAFLRRLAEGGEVAATTAPAERDRRGPGLPVAMPEGSWGDGGDHRVWLNEETSWTWPELWRREIDLIELIGTRDRHSELEERALQQMARELLLAQSSDWQFLITTGSAVDYATERFRDHIAAVDTIRSYVDSLRRGAERFDLFEELCRLESRDRLFPNLELDHWLWKQADEALTAPREGESDQN